MFNLREAKGHTITIERHEHNGMYTVQHRAGVTVVHKVSFDTGREAWRAFRLAYETLVTNY